VTESQIGFVSDGDLTALRERVGEEVTISTPPHLTEVTPDAIRHWTIGTGDRNAFWGDPDRALAVGLASAAAPPAIVLGFSKLATGYTGGLPGVHAMYAGSDYSWSRVPVVGDQLTVRVVFEELLEKTSEYAGRTWEQIARIKMHDQAGELVADGRSWVFRVERSATVAHSKHDGLEPHVYEPEELERIFAEIDSETVQGTTPQYFDDLVVGTEIPPLVKGPLTVSDNVMFAMAWGGSFVRAHGLARDYFRKHPGAAISNEQGVPDFAERVHWDRTYAASVGLPHCYDYGGQRFAWMANLLTNWVGDAGQLTRLRVEFRRFNLVGDTTWCRGRITKCGIDGDPGIVHLEIWSHDQRGAITSKGQASVRLPLRH
jgi:acyl dehydratase